MSAAKRHHRITQPVASIDHGSRCITGRLARARSLFRVCVFTARSAVAELEQEEAMCNTHGTEPPLDELFRDVAMQLLMRRDGVKESDVRALLSGVRNVRAAASHGTAWERHGLGAAIRFL
jgi:hypothetical protein